MKRALRQIKAVVCYNFHGFWKNPRVILTFLLSFVLCFLLSSRVMLVIEMYKTPVQLAEPFLWTFGDAKAIVLSSVLLLLLFSDLPKMTAVTPYYLHRISKKIWLLGQFAYVILVSAMYTFFVMAETMLLCMKMSYVGNVWSETAAILAYSSVGKQLSVPSTVKVMESILPYECALQVTGLLFLYILCVSLLILAGNLLFGKSRGMFLGLLFSLYGFLLEPDVLGALLGLEEYEMYKANVLIGWISPLSHVTYARHNFGYDRLPTIAASRVFFLILLMLLMALCGLALKKFHFTFLGERS